MKNLFIFIAILLDVASCNNRCQRESESGPDNVAVNPTAVKLSYAGGSQSISVVSNTNWTIDNWTFANGVSWLKVSPVAGSGNGTITISADENTESERAASFELHAGSALATIRIIQQGKPLADMVAGTYVGKLTYGDEVLDDAYTITVTKVNDTSVTVTADFFETPQNFNLSQRLFTIYFSNTILTNIEIFVDGNTMKVNYQQPEGYKISYRGEKQK